MTIEPIYPDPKDPRLSRGVEGVDENGKSKSISVIEERPLTIYLNSQEVVTAMTIGDHPEYLALGFLLNQGMLKESDRVTGIDFDEELEVVVVRTAGVTDVESKLEKKTRTSGCAVGTVFGDMMAGLEGLSLPDTSVHTSTFYELSYQINHTPSLYMETGAIHGTALCQGRDILAYMEDVGRHNAVDKIAGWMHQNGVPAADKVLYTTGRLTSEMVIKTALMGIPTLISRSGFTAWGVDIARQVGLTLIGRMRGKKFTCLSGQHRLVFDQNLSQVPDEEKSCAEKEQGMTECAVILAGGQANRMGGGDKGRLMLGNRSLIDRVIERITPQVEAVVLNANGDLSRFDDLSLPMVADSIQDFPGPLAGVLAGMDWAAEQGHEWLISVAADTPSFPRDLVQRLGGYDTPVVLAATPHPERGRLPQPTFGRWQVALREELRAALNDGVRKIRQWTQAQGETLVIFNEDDFFNINTPDDLAWAEQYLK